MGRSSKHVDESLYCDCVERFRLRRLLAYLRFYRYDGAFEGLSKDTTVFFRSDHLQHLVRQGLWEDAIKYFRRFLSPMLLSNSAELLLKFLGILSRICSDDATYEYDAYNPLQMSLYGAPHPGGIKLAKITSSLRSERARGSINWLQVRLKAAETVGQWVAQMPEFDELRRLPLCPGKPANVLPIGPSSRARRVQKKRLGRIPADALARSFLSKKRLPSSNGRSYPGLPRRPVTVTRMARLLEKCLQAGKGMGPNTMHPIGSPCTEGTKMIAESLVHEDNVPGNSPTRPRVAGHQECDTRKRQITGKLHQDPCSSSRVHCLAGDGTVGDLGSDTGSCSVEGTY